MSLRSGSGAPIGHAMNERSIQQLSPPVSQHLPFHAMVLDVISVQSNASNSDRGSRVTKHNEGEAFVPEVEPNGLRYGRSLMLRFDVEGNATFEEMSRTAVLRMAQEAAAVPLETNERGRVQASGLERATVGSGAQSFGTIIDVQRVHVRDIRKLDNAFSMSNEPTIEVRSQAILINADPVRAIIMRHCCLVFVPDGADSLLLLLREKFREATNQEGLAMPFEFKALEALLGTLARYFRAEYDRTAPMISSALDRLVSGKMSADELKALRHFKNTMYEFESHLDNVGRALVDILDKEDHLRLLYLTKLHENPTLLQDLWSFDSEDAEVLMENYLQDILSTRTKAHLMQHRIENTESLVALKLDATRNYLLGVNIFFSMVMIAISISTFVTGIFGMNLESNLKEAAGWFWSVTIILTALMIVLPLAGWLYFRRKGVFM